jgi:tetratricopeptide (TPR) repeat protein
VNERALRRSLLAALAVLLCFAAASPLAEDAEALVRRALERFHRAEGLREGWREVYDEGIAAAERAIELDPRHAEAHYALFLNLGRRAERSGLGTQVFTVRRLRALLDRTIELDPSHAHAWEARGEVLLALPRLLGGSTRDGVAALRRAIELDPDWPKPRLRLAEHARDQGDLVAAREHAEQARRLACDESAPSTADSCGAANRLLESLASN